MPSKEVKIMTRQMPKGAVITVATLSLAALTACGGNAATENVASTSTPTATSSSPTSTATTDASESATATATEDDTEEARQPLAANTSDEDETEEAQAPEEETTTTKHTQPAARDDAERKAQAESEDEVSTHSDSQAAPATLPTTPGDYSEGLMQAWSVGDKGTMRAFATGSVVDQLAAAKPDGALLRTACDGDMCSYSSESGQRVTLTLDTAKVDQGAEGGVVGVKIGK